MPAEENIFENLASYKLAFDTVLDEFIKDEIENDSDFEFENIKMSQIAMDKEFNDEAYIESSNKLKNAIEESIFNDDYTYDEASSEKLKNVLDVGVRFKNELKEKLYFEELNNIGFGPKSIVNIDVKSPNSSYHNLCSILKKLYDKENVKKNAELIVKSYSTPALSEKVDEEVEKSQTSVLQDASSESKELESKTVSFSAENTDSNDVEVEKQQDKTKLSEYDILIKKSELEHLFYILSYEFGETNGKNEEKLNNFRKIIINFNNDLKIYYENKNIEIKSGMLLNPTQILKQSNKSIYDNLINLIGDRRDELEQKYLNNIFKTEKVTQEPQKKEFEDIYSDSSFENNPENINFSKANETNEETLVNITFNDEKGNELNKITIQKGTTITPQLLEDKTFKAFVGWEFTDDNEEVSLYDFSKPIESDMNFYASYKINRKKVRNLAIGFGVSALALATATIIPQVAIPVAGVTLAGVVISNGAKNLDPTKENNATGIKRAGYKLKHLMEDKKLKLKKNIEIEENESLENGVSR